MRLLDFLKRESKEPWMPLLAMALVAGVANGALLALINAGASAAASDAVSFRLLLLFLATIGVFISSKNYALNRIMVVVETMVRDLRVRICDKIRRAEVPFVETLGRGQLYTTLAHDANLVSQSAFIITNAAQEAVMLVFALLYVAWLSPLAFLII